MVHSLLIEGLEAHRALDGRSSVVGALAPVVDPGSRWSGTLLVDIGVPGPDASAVIARLHRTKPDVCALFPSEQACDEHLAPIDPCGSSVYRSKSDAPERIAAGCSSAP
ncbi:MAG: hypothetical protein IPJ41_11080 [Phycisphaerales bacterium]|nr:hypothetical protein [Phycisphaerales bacterium]